MPMQRNFCNYLVCLSNYVILHNIRETDFPSVTFESPVCDKNILLFPGEIGEHTVS